MNHELNAQVAREVLGWIVEISVPFGTPCVITSGPDEPHRHERIPNYSGSLDAAFEMEEELERRDLKGAYVQYLTWNSGSIDNLNSPYALWEIIHASPAQRCEAALEAVKCTT